MSSCPLCQSLKETYRLVRKNSSAFALVPLEPLFFGHLLILPQRHARLEALQPAELKDLNELILFFKDKLLSLNPKNPPFLFTALDTPHASLPAHFHYHLLPYPVGLRGLISAHDPEISPRKEATISQLTKMAQRLRD